MGPPLAPPRRAAVFQPEQLEMFDVRLSGSTKIGVRLNIGPRTVEWHPPKVFATIGITSRKGLEAAPIGDGSTSGSCLIQSQPVSLTYQFSTTGVESRDGQVNATRGFHGCDDPTQRPTLIGIGRNRAVMLAKGDSSSDRRPLSTWGTGAATILRLGTSQISSRLGSVLNQDRCAEEAS